jgi:hypothetical protein
MNIYFAASTASLPKRKELFLKILQVFETAKHQVRDSWIVEKLKGSKSSLTANELLLKNSQLLQECDLVVVELSTPSFGVGYQFGQALANRKHVLALYPDSMPEEEVSDIVKGHTSSLVSLRSYSDGIIENVIRDYLASLTLADLRKFNFIATDEIIDYVEKGARKEGKSKSEFLRDKILSELMHKN